jgi:FkbM family methyltransferase
MIITNILNGIGKRLRKKPTHSNFNKMSWLGEKLLKHQDDQSLKQRHFGEFTLNYIRPYEVIKTHKEIFTEEIYRFNTEATHPVIIDCGANIGLSTLYFSLAYPNSKVYAFEPDETLFKLLESNIATNKLSNVHLHNEAVWIENTNLSFSNKGSEASQIDTSGQSATKVKAIQLAEFLSNFERIDFLKMDIEGAEFEVVKDCKDQLAKVQNFFLEYHGTSNETNKLIELLEIVKKAGLKVYIKMAADNLNNPFVEQTTGTPFDVQLNIFCYK